MSKSELSHLHLERLAGKKLFPFEGCTFLRGISLSTNLFSLNILLLECLTNARSQLEQQFLTYCIFIRSRVIFGNYGHCAREDQFLSLFRPAVEQERRLEHLQVSTLL